MVREIDEAWIEEAVARYRRIEALRAEFDRAAREAVVSVRARDDLVEVLVTAAGEITSVRLLPPAAGCPLPTLSRSILQAVTAAADAARWAREKLHAQIFAEYAPVESH